MAVNAADAWQHGGPADRPSRARRVERAMAAERPARPRSATPSRSRADYAEVAQHYSRPPVPRRAGERERPAEPRGGSARSGRRPTRTAETGGSRLRGILAVFGVFLVTLAAAGIESIVGQGLGMITLVALLTSSAVATFVVRRRDLLSVVICPPLVFAAVAVVNILAAPSVHLTLKTVGLVLVTLLVKGFPAMGVATAAAIVVGVVRLATRR